MEPHENLRATSGRVKTDDGLVEVEQFRADGTFVPFDPSNPLAKFSDIEQQIIKLKYDNRNLTLKQIAACLGISKYTVSYHFKRHELAEIVAYLEKDIYAKIQSIQGKSVEVLEKMLDDPNTDQVVKAKIAMFFTGPVIESKLSLPPVPTIDNIVFVDQSREDDKPEIVGTTNE